MEPKSCGRGSSHSVDSICFDEYEGVFEMELDGTGGEEEDKPPLFRLDADAMDLGDDEPPEFSALPT